jgi:hypothetical protein
LKKESFDESVKTALYSVSGYSLSHRRRLRRYQNEVALSLRNMIFGSGWRSMAVIFPRQSGKNELQAHIEAYLLTLFHNQADSEIIKIAPTWKPQAMTSLRRLERVLRVNAVARAVGWRREQGMAIRVGQARISFYSGNPSANIVGATASLLLSIDEAQAVSVEHYDTQIAPMAAATNAARIFWGTAWTADTLLAREMRLAQEHQAQPSGRGRRAFRADARTVGAEVPAYKDFVAEQIARLGMDHPAVRTQYFSEEIDAAGGLFPRELLERARGEHAWLERPRPERDYAFLIDVGGERAALPQAAGETQREHDASALVIVEVEARRNQQPLYRVAHLACWDGTGQPALRDELLALTRSWKPRRLVVDATGLGQGLAAGLEQALPGRVLRFTFTAASKTQAGWGFRGMLEEGRFLLPRVEGGLTARLREQMARCTAELGKGLQEPVRWGVPEGVKAADGSALHDDLLTAAALCTQLDREPWPLRAEALVIRARDPLWEMDGGDVSGEL